MRVGCLAGNWLKINGLFTVLVEANCFGICCHPFQRTKGFTMRNTMMSCGYRHCKQQLEISLIGDLA
uniref:Uncharacterized protein n=1 Tax=Arundo donax TaxID=35708 RepID=A0A0A9AG48_ARUDO